MPDYEKMYFELAAKVADAIDILVEAQQQGENDYVEGETPMISLSDWRSKAGNDKETP